jgi:hypothetical protein
MAETLPAYGLQWEVHDDQQPEFKVQIGDCKTAESAWQMLMGHRMPVDLQHSAYALTTTAARKPFDFSTMGLAQWKAAIHDNYDTIAIGISDAKLSFDLGHETRVITMTGLSAFAQLVFTEAALNAQFATLMARQGFMVGNAIKAKSGPKKNFPTRTMPTKRQNAATASSTADSFSAGVGGACMLAGAAGLLWRRPQAARHAAKQMMQVVKRYSPF